MNLDALYKLDHKTAEGVLAAAALSTAPNSGLGDFSPLLKRYSKQAHDVLSEIRSRLRILPDDESISARAAIDTILSNTLQGLILNSPHNRSDALKRVGQSGRLSPALYQVVQGREFTNLFYTLGISSNYVEDAVRRPDDHQHLMAEGLPESSKTISLFMKQVISRDNRNSHWLLVQTHRIGLDQIAQSAWRIYPGDVDLSGAGEPIHVLKAFVEVFGCPISVGDKKALFVDPLSFPYDAQVTIDWTGAPREHFVTFAKTTDAATSLFKVGLAYCIDIQKYRASLKRRGVKVRDPESSKVDQVFA